MAILALIAFVLAAFGVDIGGIDLIAVGLAFIALHLLLGPWPFGPFRIASRD